MNIVCIGLQYGDEGKGKIVDYLCHKADYVVRFNGGNNTGCTVVHQGQTYRHHHIPAGIVREKKCVIGTGMVINPRGLCQELDELEKGNIQIEGRLFISDRAHIIFSHHAEQDKKRDEERTNKIGTTGKGIGNCYADKMYRSGMRIVDALESDNLEEYREELARIRPYVCDTFDLLYQAQEKGEKLLLEGAQGTLLDIDYGTYPYVTSSNTISSNAFTGTGLPPRHIQKIVGIAKAYTTRVGGGAFPGEIEGDNILSSRGKEIGTTTGRLRRCGWLDMFALKYASRLNGIDCLALTKIDVLNTLAEIPVCIGYRYQGKLLTSYPASTKVLEGVEPVYKTFPGWQKEFTNQDSIPGEAADYLKFIEDELQVPIAILSSGPDREETELRQEIW